MGLDQEDWLKVVVPKSDSSTLISQTSQENAKGKGKGKKGESPKKVDKKNKEQTCHKCGEIGHLRKHCP